jgi:hypothetical protein
MRELKADRPITGVAHIENSPGSVPTGTAPDLAVANTPQLTVSTTRPSSLHEIANSNLSPIELNSAISLDLNFDWLSITTLNQLCTIWFDNYHSLIPILHQPSLLEVLNTASSLSNSAHRIVFKAIAAVTLTHLPSSDAQNPEERDKLFSRLRDQIVIECLNRLTLQSLQAMIILCIREWGGGHLNQLWNMIALAKRSADTPGSRNIIRTNKIQNGDSTRASRPRGQSLQQL